MVTKEMREEVEAFAYGLWKNHWKEEDREDLIVEYKLTPAEVDAIFELWKEFDAESGK